MFSQKYIVATLTAAITAVGWSHGAAAQGLQKVRIAAVGGNSWTTAQPGWCADRGELAKAGIEVELTKTRGGSETVQAVVSGAVDIGWGAGINASLSAFAQGGKIKIISSYFIGNADSFYYVPADSPIRSIDDLNGKSIAFSRPGSASETVLRDLISQTGFNIKSVAGGSLDAIFTMTMTKQVDVGYAFPPAAMDAWDKGEIRVLFNGDAVKSQANVSSRVNIASEAFLNNNRELATKFLRTVQSCMDWMYKNMDEGKKMFAEMNKLDLAVAEKALVFYPEDKLQFGPISGLDQAVADAVKDKFINEPLTEQQKKDIIDILPNR